jgi:hypothetical protein
VISGHVVIGPRLRILYGAVLTAEGRLPLTVGQNCVIMEQAVLRAAGRWPLELGDYGTGRSDAYLSGCSVGTGSFIATGAMVFNGAVWARRVWSHLPARCISRRTCLTILSCRLASSPTFCERPVVTGKQSPLARVRGQYEPKVNSPRTSIRQIGYWIRPIRERLFDPGSSEHLLPVILPDGHDVRVVLSPEQQKVSFEEVLEVIEALIEFGIGGECLEV